MIAAKEIRIGNVLRLDGKTCRVISQEIKGTGKSSKTVHAKLKSIEDGHMLERTFPVDEGSGDFTLAHVNDMNFGHHPLNWTIEGFCGGLN